MRESNVLKGIDAKWVVWAGLIIPAVMIFLEFWEGSVSSWVPILLGVVGLWFFNENFIDKRQVQPANQPQVGPKEQFVPPEAETWKYELDESGEFVPRKTFQPPSMSRLRGPPQYGGGRFGGQQ